MNITFTKKDRFEPWCSVHLDEEVMADQKQKLGANVHAKLEELQEAAYRKVLGHLPSDRQIKRGAKIVTWKPTAGPEVYTLVYRKRRICAFTAPIPHVQKLRYYLRFYFKTLN